MTALPRFDTGDLVYGTWRILDDDPAPTPADLAGRLDVCLESGIDTIDTAEIYGGYRVEAALGEALREAPELSHRLRLVTKAGIDIPLDEKPHARRPQYHATAGNLVHCAEKSLRLLGVDALDLFLVHRPDWLAHPEDTAAGLRQLLDEGKARQVGVSNYSVHQFRTLDHFLDGALATNQVEFSPFHMDPMNDGVFDQCLREHVRPMAWSPLGGGALFDEENEAGRRLRACLAELAPDYGDAPVDALVYAWILAHPASPTVILGTNKAERIRGAAAVRDIRLSRDHWYAIWEAAQGQSVP